MNQPLTITAETSDLMVLRSFFFPEGATAGEIRKEIVALDKDERTQLVAGIRDGSYNYA